LYVCARVSVLEACIIVCVVKLRAFFAVILFRVARDLAVYVLDGNVQDEPKIMLEFCQGFES